MSLRPLRTLPYRRLCRRGGSGVGSKRSPRHLGFRRGHPSTLPRASRTPCAMQSSEVPRSSCGTPRHCRALCLIVSCVVLMCSTLAYLRRHCAALIFVKT